MAELRPFTIQDESARYWSRRLSWLSSLIGYGLIVAVPIISNQVNVQIGALANVIIMLCMTVWALYLIFRNKEITQHLLNFAEHSLAFFSLFIRAFALVWHWLASAYFIVLFFFSLFDPGNSLKFMMGATVRSLAIIGIAAFVSGMFSRWLAKTITLSPHTQRNYPELQKRLNGWLSAALKTARILTVCVAVMLLLSAWGLFDFWNWLQNGAGQKTVDILIRIALILFFSAVGWTVLASLIENRLASDIHGRPLPSARTRTLLTLFRNALAVIISTITIMIVLSEIGVNIAPLLAGAGALGLAISFGSQTLVKDIITGVFIQFENGMNTGDLVTIGPLTGTVERMSIRSVGVRQDTGAYHIIPWSSITTFANFVRGIGSVVANYDVDRHEDADKANQALKDAVAELMENEEIRGLIIGEPNFAGIVGLSNTAFTLRVSFTTLPLKQWTVRFALDSQVKKHFDLAGVRAPVQTYQVLPAPGATPAEPLPPGGTNALTLAIDKTAALLVVHKGPGNKATLLLPLGHLFLTTFTAPTSVRARYNGGKFSPRDTSDVNHITLLREAFALFNHLFDKGDFTAFTPQLLLLAAKVQCIVFVQPQVTAFTLTTCPCRSGGIVEWRVTQGRVVLLVFMDDAVKNRPTLFCRRRRMARLSPGLELIIACALLNAWLLVSLPVKRQPYSCTPISG